MHLTHEWYPASCCGGTDCHVVPCEAIQKLGDLLYYSGMWFPKTIQSVSPDGLCHACYTAAMYPLCIFTPLGIS